MSHPKPTQGDTSWFVHDRFGMFIHWGLYALPSRHEWVQSIERIRPDVYTEKYFKHFNPTHYDPRKWAKAAREAGMKYVVLTSKHHEGFCLWDSAYTDYKSTNTPMAKTCSALCVKHSAPKDCELGCITPSSIGTTQFPHRHLPPTPRSRRSRRIK